MLIRDASRALTSRLRLHTRTIRQLAGSMLLAWTCATPAFGQIATDGSLGAAQALTGPDYQISENLGQINGGNLFHSFSQFNIQTGESATFSGPASVSNILSRVTGGSTSNIDGLLRSTISDANFYLINPAGVIMGPNASLDVSGSFMVATADSIRFSDDVQFSAATPATTLSSAPPAAFGFLNASPANIAINRTDDGSGGLTIASGKSVGFAGGSVQISNTMLTGEQSTVSLIAIQQAGEVTITDTAAGPELSAPSIDTFGDVTLSEDSTILVDGPGGGRIVVRARDATLDQSTLSASTLDDQDGGGVDIAVTGSLDILNGLIDVDTWGSGNGGDLTIQASDVLIDGDLSNGTQIKIGSRQEPGGGDGGLLTITANRMDIIESAFISASTRGDGAAGNIDFDVDHLVLDTQDPGFISGIAANSTFSSDTGGGPAGNIDIQSNRIDLLAGAQITSLTRGTGQGGVINITADTLYMNSMGSDFFARVRSTTLADAGDGFVPGNGGAININVDTLEAHDEGRLETSSLGGGNGGDLNINANSILMTTGALLKAAADGAGAGGRINLVASRIEFDGQDQETGIFTDSQGTWGDGIGGNVDIQAGSIVLTNGGKIDANTDSRSNAGTINITATDLAINGSGGTRDTGIFLSTTRPDSGGIGGNLALNATSIVIIDGGRIVSDTAGDGMGGTINITGNNIAISDHAGSELETGILARSFADFGGDSGQITINTNALVIETGGVISTTTTGAGRAGNIDIAATGSLRIDARSAGDEGPAVFTGIRSESIGDYIGNKADIIVTLDITHTWMSDLVGELTSPLGDTVTLFAEVDDNGPDQSNVTFDDRAMDILGSELNGTFKPEEPFVVLAQTAAQGDWTLSIEDLYNGDDGTLNTWTLNIGGQTVASTDTPVDIISKQTSTSVIAFPSAIDVPQAQGDPIAGDAGNVSLNVRDFDLLGAARVSSASTGSGNGGTVTINASNRLRAIGQGMTHPAGITVAASNTDFAKNAGDITLTAGKSIYLSHAEVTAAATQDGGNLTINAPISINIRDSLVTARADRDGASISIDPIFLLMSNSVINGLAGGRPVTVQIVANAFFNSNSLILTNKPISFPETDISGSVTILDTAFLGQNVQLAQQCVAQQLDESSFTLTGIGGVANRPLMGTPTFGHELLSERDADSDE